MFTSYQAKYFAHELTKRAPSDSLEKLTAVLQDAQVDLNPHQVDAALFAFRSPLSRGAILADEVGLGKTIEAGIVIAQKWAESKRKILIIVPSNIRKQWNQELMDKFYISSLILETKSFNQEIKKGNLNPFVQNEIVVCSYHFARAKEPYISQVNWDLVVIDEAHRLRNVYKPANKIANAIKKAVEQAPKILLTATPLQNSLLELFGLVSIIDDYLFGDLKSFKEQYSRIDENSYAELKNRISPVCKRTLRSQVLEYIKYTNRTAITREFFPTDEEQELYELVSNYLQRDRLYALPTSQRQLMTLILRKLLASSSFAISKTLETLAGRLGSMIRNASIPDIAEEIAENYEELEEIADEWTDDTGLEPEKPKYTAEDIAKIKTELQDLKRFGDLARSILKNSKGNELLKALRLGFDQIEYLGGHRKALIFTESTRTQTYLAELLESTEYAGKIVLFNGSNSDQLSKDVYKAWIEKHKGTDRISGSKSSDMRAALVEYFQNEACIMIATEAAAEGMNMQFCSIVVNYDLPWNPQRIEQRIGRCHRYGQQHDVVVINFLNRKNEADQRVYKILDEKFKLFSGVFGASDEVLGAIESGVDFEKRIAEIYQRCRSSEEINTAFDQLQEELESSISDNMKITKLKLLENFDEQVREKLRVSYDESRDYLNRYEEWLWRITRHFLEGYARFDRGDNSFLLTKNPFPGEKINSGPYKMGKNIDDANVYRVGHPLAQKIINACKSKELEWRELYFNLSSCGKKISILEPLIGKSGWLQCSLFSIEAFEAEDHVLLCAICDDGTALDDEQCQRMMTLPAEICEVLESVGFEDELAGIEYARKSEIIQKCSERNARFFEEELEKLDKWAEDVKKSLEIQLKQLDADIKTMKTEAKKLLKLEDKVAAQRQIKELEKKRNEMRYNLFQEQDKVEKNKDTLIEETEKRMEQSLTMRELFKIRWHLS
ncbi:MAG: SNF2-related protein [Candidatus Wallbacteria bacterium]|nr:SNF2-related protein [Candidatus Wallbacteria bacterium]